MDFMNHEDSGREDNAGIPLAALAGRVRSRRRCGDRVRQRVGWRGPIGMVVGMVIGMVIGIPIACEGRLAASDLFVAPDGDDRHAGTKEQPFATLERARDAVRAARGTSRSSITVWLRGGDYRRDGELEFSAEDSGTADAPVTWRAFPGETVRLLGGRVLPAFRPISDADVRARLAGDASDRVLEVDVRASGITDPGRLTSRGFGRPTSVAHCELFCNGTPMPLARRPNEGEWLAIAGFPEANAKPDDHGGRIGRIEDGFEIADDRPFAWAPSDDIWVHGYWAWDWANSYERVERLERETRRVVTAPPHGLYGFRKGQRFCFLNVLEELDHPGEWYLDRQRGVLYFWPPEPEKPFEAVLSVLDRPLLRFQDASHIAVQDLGLEATRADAVVIRGGSSIRIEGCAIRNIGNWGVRVDGGSSHTVARCDIWDTGDGGVSLSGGDRQTLAPAGHVVDDCHFVRQGRWSKCYVPAVLMQGVGHHVSHNLIHDHPHCAILFGGNDHLLEFNEIHHIALETGDVGAIYAGRDWTIRGNRIRHNFIHDTGGVGMGSMGVYMDDCVSGTEVFGNVFHRVHWAMFIGGGRDHRVENNVFVDCDPAVRVDGRGLDKSPVWSNMVRDFMKKQLDAVPAELYRTRYPAIADVDRYYAERAGVPPENNVIQANVCFGKWLEAGWHASEGVLKVERNSVDPEPGLVSRDPPVFRLRDDSPVWATGFKAIPFEQIGLKTKRPDGGIGTRFPKVRVASVRRAFHNGEHNAFTDLCRFRNQLYLVFRSCPDGHMVHPTASILVLRSQDDGATWEQAHRFQVADRDTRDPHFLVFRDRLFVYTGTWYSGKTTLPRDEYDLNKHLGYAVWTDDGARWNGPSMLEGTFGHYVWRAAAWGNKAYLCGRRKDGFEVTARGEPDDVQSIMLESDDGLIWRKNAFFQETAGDETAFVFESDGRVLGVARRARDAHAQLLRSQPPFTDWDRRELDRSIGGPLLARWADRWVVGGRHSVAERGPKTSLCWLIGDRLVEFAELPSGGDNSYPGFVESAPDRALVSYYSSHEHDAEGRPITAIYLAELVLE